MARPRYRVTADDASHARFYIDNTLGKSFDGFRFRMDGLHYEAKKEFTEHAFSIRGGKSKLAKFLNGWIDKYLSDEDRKKLTHGIRKRRQRWGGKIAGQQETYGETTTVTISKEAARLLRKLAKRDNVTYSVALEHYLGRVLRGQPLRRARAGK